MAKQVSRDSFVGVLAQNPKALEIFAKIGLSRLVNAQTAAALKGTTLRDGRPVLGLSPGQMKDLIQALNDAGVEG